MKNKYITFHYTNEEMVKDLLAITPIFPSDTGLDAGSGINKVWFKHLPCLTKYECEIEEGHDFLLWQKKVDWCVSGDTEFFNGYKWKKISEYVKNDKVLQYDLETGKAGLVKPLRYIKSKTNYWYELNKSNLSFKVSPHHRMLLINSKGSKIIKEVQDIKSNNYRVPTTFEYNGTFSIEEKLLRIAVAIIADGWKHHTGKYVIEIKKERKKERIRNLLQGFTFRETKKSNGYSRFYFSFNLLKDKNYPLEWYNLNYDSKKIICDEIFYWDGSIQKRVFKNKEFLDKTFSTTNDKTFDFIQFCFSSTGMAVTYTKGKNIYKNGKSCYNIRAHKQKNSRISTINKIKADSKECFCFSVPSEFLVLRYNKKIFITGNCISNPPYHLSWEFTKKALEIANVGIAWLLNNQCLNSQLTPRRIELIKQKGFYLQKIQVVADKRWFGRYYYLIFSKVENNFLNSFSKTY